MKRIVIILSLLIAAFDVCGQKLTVEKMEVAPMDLSASTQLRNDRNGNPCGLVKVQLAAVGAQFEGNVIGDVAYKTGEYWVYMNDGAYLLRIKHPNFLPLDLNFRDYGIRKVEGKCVYVLTLLMPQGSAPVQTQKLTINYTPATAMVLIDSTPYQGNGTIEVVLPVGSHDYQIAAVGYETAEGSVKLTAGSPRTVTEDLVATAQQAAVVQQPVQPIVQQPVQQAAPLLPAAPAVETITVNGVSFNMVRVEGGTFQMGSNDSEADSDEKPVHQVTLSTYSIGETEVTQALWYAVMGQRPTSDGSKWESSYGLGDNYPTYRVSWDDCQQFVEKLNQLTGKRFRLPTEAEWEYAARGGNKSRGYKYSGSNRIDDVAVYEENSYKKGSGSSEYGTHRVKTKQANELGLYDMSGNVWEWCQDWYGDYSSNSQTNPTGPSSASLRVYRGGSWDDHARYCRVSTRNWRTPDSRSYDLGLRLAL